MKKFLTCIGVTVAVSASVTACGSSAGDTGTADSSCTPAHDGLKTVREGVLTTSTYNFPPFINLDGEEASGVEGDILAAVAEAECLDLRAQPLDTGSVIPAAQSGRTDIASGNWYCTQARADVLQLVGPLYADLTGIISTSGASTFDELKGGTVGTVDGYLWNEEFQALYGSDVKVYPNPTAMYNDLKSGRVDAAVDSYGSATYANEQNGGEWDVEVAEPDPAVATSLQPGQACFPVSNDNKELADAVNEDIVKLREDGTIADILEKYDLDPAAAEPGDLRLIK